MHCRTELREIIAVKWEKKCLRSTSTSSLFVALLIATLRSVAAGLAAVVASEDRKRSSLLASLLRRLRGFIDTIRLGIYEITTVLAGWTS